MADTVYHGSIKCEGTTAAGAACRNKAYWFSGDAYMCGVHSKSDPYRQALPKNPNAKADKSSLIEYRHSLECNAATKNFNEGFMGTVICTKMGMRKEVEHHDGYVKVFPNYKHQNRADGFGCASLSPMSLGPIDHGQPNLPMATNLENMFQGNKCFPREIGPDGYPKDEFYQAQLLMYEDYVPHRHKVFVDGSSARGVVPNYSVWVDPDGNEHFLEYIESRQIYCHFYEKMAQKQEDYLKLREMMMNGYNLQICGYDGYHVTRPLEEHYLDPSRPFGHELVLYTLLTVDDPNEYPWRIHQTLTFADEQE